MSKVDSIGESHTYKRLQKKKKKKSGEVTRFNQIMRTVQNENRNIIDEVGDNHSNNLETILDDIFLLGDVLKEKPNLENVKQYKRAVKSFLDYILKNMFSLDNKTSGINIQKKKKYTIIQVVDAKLEKLVTEILQNQQDQLNYLNRIEEINGLLVDLVS